MGVLGVLGVLVKDLSYLQAFSPKILRETKRILCKGFTVEDIERFLEKQIEQIKQIKHTRKIPKGIRKEYLANSHWGKKKP